MKYITRRKVTNCVVNIIPLTLVLFLLNLSRGEYYISNMIFNTTYYLVFSLLIIKLNNHNITKILLSLINVFTLYINIQYGGYSIGILSSILLTNSNESKEMLFSIGLENFMIIVLFFIASFYSLQRADKIDILNFKKTFVLLLLLTGINFIKYPAPPLSDLTKNFNIDNHISINQYFYSLSPIFERTPISHFFWNYTMAKKVNTLTPIISEWPSYINSKINNEVYIVHIGESAVKTVLYEELLKNRNNYSGLVMYDGVFSPSFTTRLSVPRILSVNENILNYNKNLNLIDLLKSAGLEVYWISNQSRAGEHDSEITQIANRSDYYHFEQIQSTGVKPDNIMIPKIKNFIEINTNPKVIFIHSMGSHPDFCNRIPFPPKDKSKCYVESIKYNFEINSTLVQYLKNTNKTFSLIYFSDHGLKKDNNGDYRHAGSDINRSAVEVPFLIWNNSTESLQRVSKKYNLRNFIYTMSDMINVDLKTERSIHSDYKDYSYNIIIDGDLNNKAIPM